MPGQWRLIPSHTAAKRCGSDDGVSSSLRTWMCASVAPASYACLVLSTCSAGGMGPPGLSFLRGTEPVIATATITGFMLFQHLPASHGNPAVFVGATCIDSLFGEQLRHVSQSQRITVSAEP